MFNFFKNNWFILVTFIFLVGIKFYFLHLSDKSNSYSNEMIYKNGDATHYYLIAENIYKYNVYSDTNSTIPSQSATWRPPFWPFILSLFFYISTNPFIVILCKSLLEITLIGIALYLFKKKSKIDAYYFLPFLILFIEPQFLKYSVTFLSESLSAVLILLFSILFIIGNGLKKYSVVIPILAAIIVLCHPVSLFFILSLFGIYLLSFVKTNFKTAVFHGLLFSLLLLSWPYRNLVTFQHGLYLTASQGATFSKGWNEKVVTQFTNVDGDLADETMNLKYLNKSEIIANPTFLDHSSMYKMGTEKFIKSLTFKEKLQLAFKKVKSNFIPYPEKSKAVFIENLAILFRVLYLFVFLQMLYRFSKGKISFQSQKDRLFLVVFSVFIGQIIMSIYVYTGLRFNAVFGLTLLFAFVYLNANYVLDSVLFRNLKKLLLK